jgi:hypothetical protein
MDRSKFNDITIITDSQLQVIWAALDCKSKDEKK